VLWSFAYVMLTSYIAYDVDRIYVGCDFLQSQCRLDKVKKIDPFSVIANRKMASVINRWNLIL
jgi:hypothetical protein